MPKTDDDLIFDPQLLSISKQALVPEKPLVEKLVKKAAIISDNYQEDYAFAKKLVEKARKSEGKVRVEGFIREYGLNTHEGVMIMCLAEALLRVPDSHTADELIQASFKNSDWDKYLGKSGSVFVNASTWGLMLTGNIVNLGDVRQASVSSTLGKLVSRLGEPVIREALKKAMQIIGNQFVMGETIEDAFKNSASLRKEGFLMSFDMLGEGARSGAQAEQYFASYQHAIRYLGSKTETKKPLHKRTSISVKLSALYPRYELSHAAEVNRVLLPRLKTIILQAMDAGMAVSIDAEEASRLELSLQLYTALITDKAFDGYDGIGFVLQAYQKRAYPVLEHLIALAKKTHKQVPLRLVKGAYWDTEIKRAQDLGLEGYPVYTRKSYTDVSYLACAVEMLKHEKFIYPQFATHNALTIASIMNIAKGKAFEFQRLRGMGRNFYTPLLDTVPCRVYAPVGRHEELLAYLIRRLLENGANSSFVNIMADTEKPLTEVLVNPVARATERRGMPHPNIPLPRDIFSERKNSSGVDIGYLAHLLPLKERLSAITTPLYAAPIIGGKERKGKAEIVHAPFDSSYEIGTVFSATATDAKDAIAATQKGYDAWNQQGVHIRADILHKAADILEGKTEEAALLIVREAGRLIHDAIQEVREAIDFCRYYAQQAIRISEAHTVLPHITGELNTLTLNGRGVFAAISPWNFPVSIFTGQVAAALVTGNSVIAKPAEQSPLCAAFITQIFYEAGVPANCLQFLPGDGETVGKALVANDDVAGVVFTGSFETAKLIQRALAARSGPIATLIAETGGQNCMVVDSTCLPEQVVDDIITSAFNSAGQRCSALRVLYVQEEIADKVLGLLCGALENRNIGSPLDVATDIGPVIDETAKKMVIEHIAAIKKTAKTIYAGKIASGLEKRGYFVAPHIFQIENIAELKQEVFGPVLHVVRYKAKQLDKILDEINATGYGLTLGIHTRIQEKAAYIQSRVNAGNTYVNRSQVGAVVGTQPFGGEGLSGTGPKAGGPHYLLRFVTERSLCVNSAAIGGNLDLLS